jgi:uncharacterized membrane protein YhiD involved in acid resistance
VTRDKVANTNLETCLKNRNHMRNQIRNELEPTCKGWGVWVETVEITDIMISSNALFKDMQMEFRQEQKIKAEKVLLESEETLRVQKLDHTEREQKQKLEHEEKTNTRKLEFTTRKEKQS